MTQPARQSRDDRLTSATTEKPKRVIPIASRAADTVEQELYAKRQYVYPREVHGWFARWRVIMVTVTLGIYYALPWIQWGEGRQAFLIDLPGRKFNLFFWTFWPQDLFYLTALLVISALALFLFTAVAGRLWCGYACPQTVWTEVFLWIERHIEGDRTHQMRLAKSGWTREKIVKKSSKHAIWILFSAWTGLTFVGYFTPMRELTVSMTQLSIGPWELFWIAFYGFATYGNAGFLREQVCTYMCPYARFQGAMFDRDTLIISYDAKRGEPRGPRRRELDYRAAGLGECVDCTLCVQVCPTGIDIRQGLQSECIACGACIDVCDTVMNKIGYPKGLIRYTTQNEIEEGKPRRILRPRVIVYGAILVNISAALVAAVLLRVPVELDVLRDRNALYRTTVSGAVENAYTLKIMNMDTKPHRYTIGADGVPDLRLVSDVHTVAVSPGEVIEVPVTLQADPAALRERSTDIRFILQAHDDAELKIEEESRFLGPEIRR